ncbi:hypothetical protein [Leptodesmis sichuanensis]|uniref:hypothetical protein n=1 Tax=Leptodesmis sichuanensis TaxID=2906798 RepID=UPI001F18A7EA|nr:hypothetical protein [Leptodesmis sichuanensis]UIE39111.1 hypothetical protein KIK02_05840 [Leptodesmis sichuanensis A121]
MLIILRVTDAWTAPTSLDTDRPLFAISPGAPSTPHSAPPGTSANPDDRAH